MELAECLSWAAEILISFFHHHKTVDLAEHYRQLWTQSLEKFRAGRFEYDPYLQGKEDRRYGLTLRARPSDEVSEAITQMLADIKAAAPNQYYYPQTDLHVTVLSVISCYAGFALEAINPQAYVQKIRSAVDGVSPFGIWFRGVTASPSCILVQGFPDDNQLNDLRDSLRQAFYQSGLQHSVDARYRLQTAHVTAIRFRQRPDQPEQFIKKISGYRDYDFGCCLIDKLKLVGNDWYQQAEKVEMIRRLTLGS